MTREEADLLLDWITGLMDSENLWSAKVDTVRRTREDEPVRYRILLERLGDPHPVAIYRARILTRALSGAGVRAHDDQEGYQ